MTKLEEKLIQLGYHWNTVEKAWIRPINKVLWIYLFHKNWIPHHVHFVNDFCCQEEINDLQQAFDVMQNDLEELKKYEEIYNKTN